MAEYKTINEITNVSTQANDDDLLIMWDKAREKTVKIKNRDFNKNNQPKTLETPIEVDNVEETTVEGALGAINDKVKNFTAGVAFNGTRSAYNTAKLIPEGSDGHIPSGALVIITDEGKTYVTNGTGSSQTLELVANATFNGSHEEWNALTSAQKAMYNIVNFNDDEAIGLQISDVVQDGNMNPVTSNGVYDFVNGMNLIAINAINSETSLDIATRIAHLITQNCTLSDRTYIGIITLAGYDYGSINVANILGYVRGTVVMGDYMYKCTGNTSSPVITTVI